MLAHYVRTLSLIAELAAAAASVILCSCSSEGSQASSAHEAGSVKLWGLEYDDSGRLRKIAHPGGRVSSLNYETDPAEPNRIRRVNCSTSGEPDVELLLDALGRRSGMVDGIGRTDYAYDGFNRLTAVQRSGGDGIVYSHDTQNRVREISLRRDFTIKYEYDFLGRPARMSTPIGDITYEYQSGRGQIIRTLPNGVQTVWQFDSVGGLASITHVNKSGLVLARYAYAYDSRGRIREVQEQGEAGARNRSYTYDQVGRLAGITGSSGEDSHYSYDGLGNRTEISEAGARRTMRYDALGRILSYDSQAVSTDDAGNLETIPDGDGAWSYRYTAENLLRSAEWRQRQHTATRDSVGEDRRIEYEADGDGILRVRSAAKSRTTYVADALSEIWRPLIETDDSGVRRFYIWEGGAPLAIVTEGKAEFFLTDHLGSARLVADEDGKIMEAHDYGPFGKPQPPMTGARLHPGFAGLMYDPATGLYCCGPRAYDPSLGRFLQLDPSAALGLTAQLTLSLYAYCSSDPVNYIDRTGLSGVPFIPGPQGFGFPYPATPGLLPGLVPPGLDLPQLPSPNLSAPWPFIPGPPNLPSPGIPPSLPGVLPRIHMSTTGPGKRGGRGGGITRPPSWNPPGRQGQPPPPRQPKPGGPPKSAFPGPLGTSPIGGVYLRGAESCLSRLGNLVGVALDDNGRLLLLSEGERQIQLPALRLDDVVAVFRSVYEQGDAPYVSIDPDPSNPHGPLMFVRLGPGPDRDHHANWVLYHCDRKLKAYSINMNNITKTPVNSHVPGYRNLFDSDTSDRGEGQIWERFWLVPDSVKRTESASGRLSLFDVPLRVKTERMQMRRGRLVPASDPRPSPAARAFSNWFGNHLDDIASEALEPAPDGSDAGAPVAVFSELRHLAAITAIASNLRDRGIQMPQWMRDCPIRPIHVDAATPAVTVQQSNSTHLRQIYGGATLSPDGETVLSVRTSPELDDVARRLLEVAAGTPSFSAMEIEFGGRRIEAVALPGDETREGGALLLDETDISIPIRERFALELVRHFNSFFEVRGPFGSSWSLDLPSLVKQPVPVRRSGDQTEYRMALQLLTPLHSRSEVLSGVFAGNDRRVGEATDMLVTPDGKCWHFDRGGRLVARLDGPVASIYRRDGSGRINRIEGWCGNRQAANLQLTYDDHGQIARVLGSDGQRALYDYDGEGNLASVTTATAEGTSQGTRRGYRYAGGLVAAIERDGTAQRRFDYSPGGQLAREEGEDGSVVTYEYRRGPAGLEATGTRTGSQPSQWTIRYDAGYRPVEELRGDGARIRRRYDRGKTTTEVTLANGDRFLEEDAADQRHRSLTLPSGGIYEHDNDDHGRLVEARQDGHTVVRQTWAEDGRLVKAAFESFQLHPAYDDQGVMTTLLVTGPQEGPRFDRWLELTFDGQQRLQRLTDFSGLDMQVSFDREGRPVHLECNQGQTLPIEGGLSNPDVLTYGLQCLYELATGAPISLVAARSDESYPDPHQLDRLGRTRCGDGSEFHVMYHETGPQAGLIRSVSTPQGVSLSYTYAIERGMLSSITTGTGPGVRYAYAPDGTLAECSVESGSGAAP